MRLRFNGVAYDRTLPLISREVQPEGIELEYVVDLPNAIFRRMFSTEEFDASELSSSNFIIERARGDERFVALPVFPSRVFRHNSIYVNADAGIDQPRDLIGRRVGIPEYLQTANFWARGILQDEYGVRPEDLQWVRGDTEKLKLPLPAGLHITQAPPGRTLSELLERGEIDALISPRKPACIEAGSPRVRRLFPDYPRVEADYFRRTGHFPIMHLVAIRRHVYERDRSLARRLYDAFVEAKRRAYEALRQGVFLTSSLPLQIAYAEESRATFGDDPFPYGLAANRHTLATVARYVHEQGMADRVLDVEEIVVPELLDT
ncbi:MAG TPA: ABC transporter substrate-binding protein [Chloroflexota bacterium]|nr:ABC transporter substrate-binding protein [Chloroflexota bacterium]